MSIFKAGILLPVEKRYPPRFMENIFLSVYTPIDRLFRLGATISVTDVGRAMHKVGADSTIQAKNHATSSIGTLISYYGHYSEIRGLGEKKE